jgi:2-keto-3-deoxy-L-rhamnonate aldolase RhmA
MGNFINATRRQLEKGELALGMGLRQARTVDIANIAKTCDFDWLFIDMEHNSMSMDSAAQICNAALSVGITPIVRVPGHESFHASRLLDCGALGIVVPHVNDAAEARRAVDNCRFPPHGKRSIPGGLPQVSFQTRPLTEVIEHINNETLVVVMIETRDGLDNLDEIAAVPGIDVLLVGTNDLAAELGVPGQLGHQLVRDAVRRVCAACKENGKFPGVGGVYDEPTMRQYIELGARFILSGSDLAFMMHGARVRSQMLRSIELKPLAASAAV